MCFLSICITPQSHLLLDSGRILHPSDRDFSYYSKVHNVYTCIDLLFVDHLTLELLQALSIENITISNHAPISATFTLPQGNRDTWSWRLNYNLLEDSLVVAGVSDTLTHYFKENTTTDVEEAMIWEGHKAVVRGDGELISQGARCKRVRQADFQRVLGALQQAEFSISINLRCYRGYWN